MNRHVTEMMMPPMKCFLLFTLFVQCGHICASMFILDWQCGHIIVVVIFINPLVARLQPALCLPSSVAF